MDAPTTGSIEVTVTDWVTGTPLVGGCVEARTLASTVVATQCTGADGVYDLTDLAPGTYIVLARSFPTYAPIYAGPATVATSSSLPAAQQFTVVAGATTAAAVPLLAPKQIAGRVLTPGGAPVVGAVVEFYATSPATWPVVQSSVVTDANGWYVSAAQPCTGTTCQVRVAAAEGVPATWFRSAASRPYASSVTVGASSAFIVAPLYLLSAVGAIEGTMIKPAHFTSSTFCYALHESYSFVLIDVVCGSEGSPFAFHDIPAGPVRLCAIDSATATLGCGQGITQWSGNETSHGTDIIVTAGATTSVTPSFGPTEILLTLYPGHSSVVADGCVDLVVAATNEVVDTQCTGSDSKYRIVVPDPNVAYRLDVRDFSTMYDFSIPPSSYPTKGWVYEITEYPEEFSAWVTATIHLPAGIPATDACLRAIPGPGRLASQGRQLEACATGPSGGFTLLVPYGESFRLYAYSKSGGAVPEWFTADQQPTLDRNAAGWIWISDSPGGNTRPIVNVTLETTSSVTGSVSTSAGSAVTSGCIRAYDMTGAFMDEGCVDASGTYSLSTLGAGVYRLRYESAGTGASQWVGGTTWTEAPTFTVGAGATVTRNVVLAASGTISGTVTDTRASLRPTAASRSS